MNFRIIRNKDALTVFIAGELDHHNAGIIRESVDIEIQSARVRELIFDFTHLDFMDSSGIGILMGRAKLLQSCGGKVVVAGAPGYIERIICLSGLENLIELRKGA